MEKAGTRPKDWYFRNVIIYSLICCLTLNTSVSTALALEAFDIISSSGATPTQWGNHTIINTGHGAIIDWNNFNTSTGQSVTFNQFDGAVLSSRSAVLNRITSATATQFNGALNGNGRVFVVNPAGIIFGSGSTINVGQLVASGLNMSNDAFNAVLADPANQMDFEGGGGTVTNLGGISAGSVFLVGKKVVNRNGITAPNGEIVLAAGDNVYLAQDGSSVLIEVATASDGTADVLNRSSLNSRNGTIVLAAGDTLSHAVSSTGVLTAKSGTIRYQAAKVESRDWINASAETDAAGSGSVVLDGTEEVFVGLSESGAPGSGWIKADAASNGDGGSVTLQSQGTVIIGAGHSISARGGTTSGSGGSVTVTADHFSIAGDIDASPTNTDFGPGTVQINTPSVTIANGANTGGTDTIYEQFIENLSDKGTGIVVNSEQGITIPDIVDGEIKGRYGNIEFHTTNPDSFFRFTDTSDTISTTLGDIIIGTGSGGMTIGNLETGKDVSDVSPTPGRIILSTSNRGSIKIENLRIKDGWGHAEINVDASGELTVNGSTIIGSDSPILNIPGGQDAEAIVYFKSGDNMFLNGDVTVYAQGLNAGLQGGVTKAYIGIFAGTNETWWGNLTINGDLTAKAISTSVGTSEATVEIDAWGTLTWGPGAADPLAEGDSAQVSVQSKDSASDTNADGDVAQIIVNVAGNAPQVEGTPDFATTHMGTLVQGNVLDNDAHPQGETLTASLAQMPSHALLFSMDSDGNYSYTSQAGYVGQDTFTYIASSQGGEPTNPILVTITMTNGAPTAAAGTAATHMGAVLQGTVATNISDPDGDPLTTALVTGPAHGTLTFNPDGTYSYTPAAGYVGDDTFTYSAVDAEIGAVPVQAPLTITMTNVGPTANADMGATTQGISATINVLANDSDPEADPLIISSVTYNGTGTVVISNNTLVYTPGKNFLGEETFTYSATDGQIAGVPVTATVTVTVGPEINVPPTYFMPAGPELDKADIRISGCPALTKWTANEIGFKKQRIEVWVASGLASARGVQPCDACIKLRDAARILADSRGFHAAAVAKIIDEFGTSTRPVTEELAAYITNAMAHDSEARKHYEIAEEYFTALADYVDVLHNDIGLPVEKAAQIVADKYIDPLAAGGNVGVASYVAARLDSVTMFLTVVNLNRAKVLPRIGY